jgi:hypothetical protein
MVTKLLSEEGEAVESERRRLASFGFASKDSCLIEIGVNGEGPL